MATPPPKCSWTYLCLYNPPGHEDEHKDEEEEEEANITWTDKELVNKIKRTCPNIPLVNWFLLKFCTRGKLFRVAFYFMNTS